MDLDTYLRENSIDGVTFAEAIGMTEASLSRIRRGHQNITRDTIRRIVAATKGAVTVQALVFPVSEGGGAPDHAANVTAGTVEPSPGISGEDSHANQAAVLGRTQDERFQEGQGAA